ncbi:MAG: 4Fe-4S dicluster domain-containing protein [Rhodospirillaceae bacterium]|nr:4Fe-4S dicluster domain-containing protein [Rhodospirillaceae bacterium]
MSQKWNLIVDVARCDNCRNCFLATKDEHIGNDFPGYAAAQPEATHNWVDIVRHERGTYPIAEARFMPVMCNHCDDAPCMKAAKNGAITKRPDGIVIIDPEKSNGQKAIVEACPYGAVYWNDEKQIPQAWIFDAHLLDQGWTKPRVAQSCPTEAFRALKIDDAEMARIAAQEGLAVLKPELNTRPRVHYKNLHLMTTCFVGGSVVADVNGVEECAEGAEVVLMHAGREAGRATTDTFGEFKIDKLPPNSGRYELHVTRGAARSAPLAFDLADASPYLGVIKLG